MSGQREVTPIPKPGPREKHRNPGHQAPVERPCDQCGKVYKVYASQVRHRGSRYCSVVCYQETRRPRLRTCRQCGAEFAPPNPGRIGMGKFCSHKCHMAYEQERNPRRREFTCPCGKTFTRVKGQGVGKYCSRDCAAAGRVRPESEHTRGKGWAATAEGVRVRDGRLCVRCGAPELPKRRHAVDHIVPWVLVKHRPDIANDPSNLATLCHPCHGVKTAITEPRLLRGDFLALREFYGDEVMATAKAALLAMDVSHG